MAFKRSELPDSPRLHRRVQPRTGSEPVWTRAGPGVVVANVICRDVAPLPRGNSSVSRAQPCQGWVAGSSPVSCSTFDFWYRRLGSVG